MRIDVTMAGEGFEDQTRAYAEFRVFSTLARLSAQVEGARVALTRPPAGPRSVICDITVTLAGGDRTRVRARGGHAYDAINRAAQRISDGLRRCGRVAMTS